MKWQEEMSGATTRWVVRSAIPHVLFESGAHPLPKSGGVGIESPERQKPQFAAGSALWKQHLQTCVGGAHEGDGMIDNLFVCNRLVDI